jgi:hypothetical protein
MLLLKDLAVVTDPENLTNRWTECEPEVIADFQPAINATPAAARVGEVADIVPIVA